MTTNSGPPATPSSAASLTGIASPPRPDSSSHAASPRPPPQQRRSVRPASADFLSDRATIALVRRTLCAQHAADRGKSSPVPIEELLPPLTSRNDVDLQLYALLSIVLRDYVQTWYSKISPDETFVAEIVQIIAHCTRALEQRLRKVDLESLLLDELPELLDAHLRGSSFGTRATCQKSPSPTAFPLQRMSILGLKTKPSPLSIPHSQDLHGTASHRSQCSGHLPFVVSIAGPIPGAQSRGCWGHYAAGQQ